MLLAHALLLGPHAFILLPCRGLDFSLAIGSQEAMYQESDLVEAVGGDPEHIRCLLPICRVIEYHSSFLTQ